MTDTKSPGAQAPVCCELLSVTLDDALRMTGFSKCKFGPDSEPCEKCETPQKQLYWRSVDPYSQDGEYFCDDCVVSEAEENARYR